MESIKELLHNLKEHHIRTLLIHYRWDVKKVYDVFAEKGKERLCLEASVMVHDGSEIASVQLSSPALCEICMEDVPFNKMTKMDCSHCFCNNCKATLLFEKAISTYVKIKEELPRKVTEIPICQCGCMNRILASWKFIFLNKNESDNLNSDNCF